jgi:hypothetical protein
MTATALARIQSDLVKIDRESGEDYIDDGTHIQTEFHAGCWRNRTRHLVFFDGRNVGFIDYIVPFNIFKSPHEWVVLEFWSPIKKPFDGVEWVEAFYPQDPDNPGYLPTFANLSDAAAYFRHITTNNQQPTTNPTNPTNKTT